MQVQEAYDELAAACLMVQPDTPALALLAFDTLLVEFPSICAAIRDLRPDVTIVALIPEARRHEVGLALDAGADEFIVKADSLAEIEARLRLIRHHVAADSYSLHRAQEEESPRDEASSEDERVAEDPSEAPSAVIVPLERTVPAVPAEPTAERPSFSLAAMSAVFRQLDFQQAIIGSVRELGVVALRPCEATTSAVQPVYTAWTLLLLRRGPEAHWCALRLDVDDEPAQSLYRRIKKQVVHAAREPQLLLRQVLTLAQDALWTSVSRRQQGEVYLPLTPVASEARQFPAPLASTHATLRTFGLCYEEVRLRLTVTVQGSARRACNAVDLQPNDLLAAPIQTADGRLLLREGVLLDANYVDKIQSIAYVRQIDPALQVFRAPPSIARVLRQL